jgi:hypothetical protein
MPQFETDLTPDRGVIEENSWPDMRMNPWKDLLFLWAKADTLSDDVFLKHWTDRRRQLVRRCTD